MEKQKILDAISYIGIDPKDFNLKDSYFTRVDYAHHKMHGRPHIYRVMIGTALIAQELREPWLGRLAFCAAFLHNQNRLRDGHDRNHGLRAAQKNFDLFTNVWDKYGFTAFERQYIRAACADHCVNDGHQYSCIKEVSKIVSDADALDRCRFHGAGRLNPDFLYFKKESKSLIKAMESICMPTNRSFTQEISFVDFIAAATTPAIPSPKTYNRAYSPDMISDLEDGQVFVFNQKRGGHSRFRSAQTAVKKFGAASWVGEGLTGHAYAIPCDYTDLKCIAAHVYTFIQFAKANPQLEFLVTPIACGTATTWNASDIAPLFKEAIGVENILLPKIFVSELEK